MEEMGDENMKGCDDLDGRETEWERDEGEILIESHCVPREKPGARELPKNSQQ